MNLAFVGVVFVDFPFVVGAQLVGGVVEIMCGDDVSFVVLAHPQPVDCQLFAVLIAREDCQFDCFAVLHCCPFHLKPLAADSSHVHAGENGQVQQAQSSGVVLYVAVDKRQNRYILQVLLVEVYLVAYIEEEFGELALALFQTVVFELALTVLYYVGFYHL